jgi:hypothetical protein
LKHHLLLFRRLPLQLRQHIERLARGKIIYINRHQFLYHRVFNNFKERQLCLGLRRGDGGMLIYKTTCMFGDLIVFFQRLQYLLRAVKHFLQRAAVQGRAIHSTPEKWAAQVQGIADAR